MEGIEYRHSKVLLDEIPGAYKDIDEVMENAKDLVEVKYVLKQFVNVKGDWKWAPRGSNPGHPD